MIQMRQGENYEEDISPGDSNNAVEAEENTSSIPDTIYGVNRHKFIIIIAAIILVLMILRRRTVIF